jgi:hypothetical protein
MKNLICVTSISWLVVSTHTFAITAAELGQKEATQIFPSVRCHGLLGSCWDDYCRKPLPPGPCAISIWACDDYCRKPEPAIWGWCGPATCDTYHRKTWPSFHWQLTPRLRCGSSYPSTPGLPFGSNKSAREFDAGAPAVAAELDDDQPAPPETSNRRRIATPRSSRGNSQLR